MGVWDLGAGFGLDSSLEGGFLGFLFCARFRFRFCFKSKVQADDLEERAERYDQVTPVHLSISKDVECFIQCLGESGKGDWSES